MSSNPGGRRMSVGPGCGDAREPVSAGVRVLAVVVSGHLEIPRGDEIVFVEPVHLLVGISALATVLLADGGKQPQAGRDEAQARLHFSLGERHYNLGEFERALGDFKEAYRLSDLPEMLFNIGQCQYKLGDHQAALHSFRAYLRMARSPRDREDVEARIKEIEDLVARKGAIPPAPIRAGEVPAIDLTTGTTQSSDTPTSGGASPWYSSPWIWAGVGAVVVAAATLILVSSSERTVPESPLGAREIFR